MNDKIESITELQDKIDHLQAEIVGRDNMLKLLLKRSNEHQTKIRIHSKTENMLRTKLVALQAEYDGYRQAARGE